MQHCASRWTSKESGIAFCTSSFDLRHMRYGPWSLGLAGNDYPLVTIAFRENTAPPAAFRSILWPQVTVQIEIYPFNPSQEVEFPDMPSGSIVCHA